MSSGDTEFLDRIRRARDQLSDQFLYHPEVSLIDIGFDPEDSSADERLVLRIHLRTTASREQLDLPVEIDGIPVCVIIADYKLE